MWGCIYIHTCQVGIRQVERIEWLAVKSNVTSYRGAISVLAIIARNSETALRNTLSSCPTPALLTLFSYKGLLRASLNSDIWLALEAENVSTRGVFFCSCCLRSGYEKISGMEHRTFCIQNMGPSYYHLHVPDYQWTVWSRILTSSLTMYWKTSF